jgi:proteasome lid subunit RPN8/RPN11
MVRVGLVNVMIHLVRFERSVADSILTSALEIYPRESVLLLRGKADKDQILINDVLIPPLATHGWGFSQFPGFMLPMDLSIMGVSHSHPSGALQPSVHDLNHFYGRIMVITAHPFQSYNNIAAFNSHGDKIPHEVIPDRLKENNDQEHKS